MAMIDITITRAVKRRASNRCTDFDEATRQFLAAKCKRAETVQARIVIECRMSVFGKIALITIVRAPAGTVVAAQG